MRWHIEKRVVDCARLMPVLARAFLLLVFVMTIVGGTVFAIASKRVNRTYDIAAPAIVRASDPAEIERGSRLFRTDCLDCHAGAPATAVGGTSSSGNSPVVRRPVGGRVTGAPSFLGEVWAPNLTGDVETGIGGWTDGRDRPPAAQWCGPGWAVRRHHAAFRAPGRR